MFTGKINELRNRFKSLKDRKVSTDDAESVQVFAEMDALLVQLDKTNSRLQYELLDKQKEKDHKMYVGK